MSKPEESDLERDYCAGQISLRKLAEIYGISEGAIRKRALKHGWVRSEKVGTQVRKKSTHKRQLRTDLQTVPDSELEDELEENKSVKQLPETTVSHASLNEREALFVDHFIACRDKYVAHKKAGYSGGPRAARLLYRKLNVAREINRRLEEIRKTDILSEQGILRYWHEIATADPGELSQLRRCCCRYCWGENFRYQWRDVEEFDKEAEKASAAGKPQPDYGGLGFVANDDPNPDCPRCGGEGIASVHYADTRDLTGPARLLIAGVKQTKFGIEIMTRDQDAALKNLASFHRLAASEQERERRLLEMERIRLSNEKIQEEIESLKKVNAPEKSQGPEEDYQLQALTPDETPPDNPVL